MKKTLTFLKSRELPTTRDAADYLFEFSLIDQDLIGLPEEKSSTTHHSIKVGITGTMQAVWMARQGNIDLHKVCFEYGKRELIFKAKEGIIRSHQELEIESSQYPNECPFESDRIKCLPGTTITIEINN